MLLCEETIGQYPAHLLSRCVVAKLVKTTTSGGDGSDGTFSVNKDKEALPDYVLAKYGNVSVPKNKNARRRLAQAISANVDKIDKATRFKKAGKPTPASIQRAIRQVTK